MTSSHDVAGDVAGDVPAEAGPDELPGALTSMWRLFKLGYHHEPRLLVTAFVLSLLAAVPDALIALWLALLGKGAVEGNDTLVMAAAIGLGVSATLTWLLRVVSSRLQRRFRDRVTIALEGHVAGLQARVVTVAHQERPDYLDRLAVLRDQIFVLDHLYMSVFSTCGWILRLAVTIVLLMSIHWTLALLVLAALPTVLTSGWRPGVERRVQEDAAPHQRRAAHYYRLATTAPSARELRVLGLGQRIAAGRRTAWESWYVPTARVRWASALWHTVAWTVFGVGFVLAVVWVTNGLDAPVGQVLLVLAAGGRLSGYVGATVGEIGFLRGVWLDGSRRLAWLEDYAALQRTGDLTPPARLQSGIRFDGVSFAYPGARDRLVLEDVDLALPAGSVVAVVGENGAGKSTLVKLLTQMYVPTGGRILVDGVSLAGIDPEQWRDRVAAAFQDFYRFELAAQQSIGVGDLPRLDDPDAAAGAVGRAGADDVVRRLEDGLATQLGPHWPGGVDLSFGQWQKLALARGFMREHPLLLVLDEPTAALDAETEHALFERFAAAARTEATDGRITVLVSHRFSTVRMADLIVVLDGSRVVEVGSHAELMARRGKYAQLYDVQAASYR
jgi:ATP-binding cassette, subfamily B, bacterial